MDSSFDGSMDGSFAGSHDSSLENLVAGSTNSLGETLDKSLSNGWREG